MKKNTDHKYAQELDSQDPLAEYRNRFYIDDPDLLYLDGNSLGRLPQATIPHLMDVVENQWGKNLIRGWNQGWFEKPIQLGSKLAKLIGAEPDEVLVCDTTSVNLFKLTAAALQYQGDRSILLSDEFNFPSDLYIFQGVIELLGNRHRLHLLQSEDSITIGEELIQDEINEDTALVALTQVAFKSAFMYQMEEVTRLTHQAGGLVLWDLSHSVGVVPLKLTEWGV
ncbi:MAG: aminotransferase class V-fold PLP-dependent enzyme, partial [Anaerolineales bacterium]|nr:aminotransferase class V-fold PLP-dependent enzyme [Anaerolineales bacterium]